MLAIKRNYFIKKAKYDAYRKAKLKEQLPKNEQLQMIVVNYLFPDGDFESKARGVSSSHTSNTIAAIFDGLCDFSLDYKKIKVPLKQLLRFAMYCEYQKKSILTKDEELLNPLLIGVKSLRGSLRKINDESLDEYHEYHHKEIHETTFDILNFLIDDLKTNTEKSLDDINESIWLGMLYKIVIDDWDDVFVYCSQITMNRIFRMLGDIARISNWDNSIEMRCQLLEIIRSFGDVEEGSNQWTEIHESKNKSI